MKITAKKSPVPCSDRIDIHVEVPLVDFRELSSDAFTGESSGVIPERVAHDRILKVARALADLAGKSDITGNEVLEAIQFRSLNRQSSQ